MKTTTKRSETELLTICRSEMTSRDDRNEAERELIQAYGYDSDYIDEQVYGGE